MIWVGVMLEMLNYRLVMSFAFLVFFLIFLLFFFCAGHRLPAKCKLVASCQYSLSLSLSLFNTDIIHTVGPMDEDDSSLKSCYQNCLRIVTEKNFKSVVNQCHLIRLNSQSKYNKYNAKWLQAIILQLQTCFAMRTAEIFQKFNPLRMQLVAFFTVNGAV